MSTFAEDSTSTSNEITLGPLVLEPILVERIWGTRDLSAWHTGPADGKAVGEIWLTAEDCKVAEGAAAGQTLADLTARTGEPLGDARGEGFPLLMKLLFPHEKLSVQVHPNDQQAQALGMPRGKTECWYVLSAEPGAEVALGFREKLTNADVKRAIEDGTIEDKLHMVPVKAGDLVFVDAGTVHAIGPGMVVLETQQYSDTTYRLWDYGRPRELHVDAGMAVTRTETRAGFIPPRAMGDFTRLAECEYFAVDRFDLLDDAVAVGSAGKLQILVALGSRSVLTDDHGQKWTLPRGKAVILPAGVTGYRLQAEEAAQVIRVLQP
jgi:mannose-6-phosphate isomerase